ncbi:MAG: META domain-containing protein [Anaerolineales bacterium]|nr:META domain-containing protein [Anaerolineales bacterium]
MQAETTYIDLLENAQTYQVFGQTLIVTSEEGKLVYAANRAPLEGTNWRLTAFGSVEHPQTPVEGADFTAQFVRQPGVPSGLIVGGTGCNDYNAVYAANLSEIRVNTPARTNNAGCPTGLPEQELQYYLALDSAHSYRILGDTLEIFYGEGQALTYTAFVPAIPQPEGGPLTWLNRSRWWLVSMGNVVLRPGTTIAADFAINADGMTGAISGPSGCNTYNAPILGYFRVGPAVSTKMLCAEPAGVMEQESAYLVMLSTANSIFRSGNQLVIGSAGGLLVYYNRPVPILPIEPPVTATPPLPPTVTPEAPTAVPPTPEAPTPEPPPATPEPTLEPVEPMPPSPPCRLKRPKR